MADIFISYAREDRPAIERLSNALETAGFSVWWDRDVGGGSDFAASIEKELAAANTVIVAWSTHSVGSHWVRDEADYARGEQKLLPISLDGTLPPLGFRQIHALEFQYWDDQAEHACFTGLLKSLGEAPGAATVTKRGAEPRHDRSPPLNTREIVRPGIAVLPLENMSTNPELEYFADGLTEDIITVLSANRHLSVAARTSSFAFKGQSKDIREIGAVLNARYVVEGSVRQLGDRARITVQFIEAESGTHVWAKKFDEPVSDLLASPDHALEIITAALFTQIFAAEADRSMAAPRENLTAWEYCVRGAIAIGQGAGAPVNYQRVIKELENAVEAAPDYPLGHALIAWAYNAGIINGLYKDDEVQEIVARSKIHFKTARDLGQDDLLTQTYLGGVENFAGMQDRALHRLEGVLARNPANAEALFIITMVYAYLGRYDEAECSIERAAALSPEKGFSRQHDWYKGMIVYLRGDYEVAGVYAERKVRDEPGYAYPNIIGAICAYNAGDLDMAHDYIARAKEYNPQIRPEKLSALIFGQHDKEKAKREYEIVEQLWADANKIATARPSARAKQKPQSVEKIRPGLVILPFANMSTDTEIEFIADGLTEDVIMSLATHKQVEVAPRAAVFALKDQHADIKMIKDQLGARYIVEGSVRKMGARARINVQLIDAETGAHIWAKRFDSTLEALLESPDNIAEKVAGSVFAQFASAEADRANVLPDEALGAWECCAKAIGSLGRGTASMFSIQKTLPFAEKAIILEPDNAVAHALVSWIINAALVNGVWEDGQYSEYLEKAKKHLRLAKSLAHDDLFSLIWIGAAENYAGMHERSVQTLEAVLKRNPASAEAYYCICLPYAYLGRFDDARRSIKRAIDIAPEGGFSSHHGWYFGLTEHLAGDYKTALPDLTAHAHSFPDYGYVNAIVAIELACLERRDEAKRYIEKTKEHNPQLSPEKLAGMICTQFDREKGAREYEILKNLWDANSE